MNNRRIENIKDGLQKWRVAITDHYVDLMLMNNRNKVRFIVKLRVFEIWEHVFEMQPEKFKHSDACSDVGKRLVEIARTKIGYSPKTADCDIYYNLMSLYRRTKQSNVQNL